jgi:hypothetical protein
MRGDTSSDEHASIAYRLWIGAGLLAVYGCLSIGCPRAPGGRRSKTTVSTLSSNGRIKVPGALRRYTGYEQ